MPKLGRRKPRALKPSERDEIYWDNEGIKRLGVRVRPNHPSTYVLMYRPDARATERRITLGLVSELTLPEARKLAILQKADVHKGIDPLDEKHHKQHRLTVAEAFERHKKERWPFLCKQHARHRERVFERHFLKPLGTKVLSEVRKRDIVPIIDRIRRNTGQLIRDGKRTKLRLGGEQAAINAHRHMTAFLSWAYNSDLIESHPYRGLKLPGKPATRQRVLDAEELKATWAAASTLPDYWGLIFKMLMACGQRRMEVTEMHHRELDLEWGTWTLPSHRVKNRQEHTIPISSLMREIINQAPGKKGFLFESPIDASRPVHSFGNPTDKLRTASGVQDFRIHDLRHSVITHMTDATTLVILYDVLTGIAGPRLDQPHSPASAILDHILPGIAGAR